MQKKTADYVKQTIALANRNGSVSNGEEEADSEKDMPKSITDPIVSIIEFESGMLSRTNFLNGYQLLGFFFCTIWHFYECFD